MNATLAIEIYTEYTPNPESLKFVTNRMLLKNDSVDCKDADSTEHVPMAKALFALPYVSGVFIANNFITISKKAGTAWEEIIPEVKQFIREYLTAGKTIVSENYFTHTSTNDSPEGKNGELEIRIRELLDKYVKPAVEMDGGAIQFKSFNEGIVTLVMQGSCSGCPSSTLTLKAGIEGMLKRMIPEVQEVVAEEG